MSAFNNKFFRDQSIIRAIIIGVIQKLNKATSIKYSEERTFEIPCYFSLGVEESFLYDNFLKEFTNLENAETQYDTVPRMLINYESDTINRENLTNPYTRIQFNKQVEIPETGEIQIKPYTAKVKVLPVIISLSCEILATNLNELLLINENLLKTFYKNKTFQVQTELCRIPGVFRLPEDLTKDRLLEKSFADKDRPKINFSFEVLSYIPVLRNESVKFLGKKMQGGIVNDVRVLNSNTDYVRITTDFLGDDGITNIPSDVRFYDFSNK